MSYNEMQIITTLPDIVISELLTIQSEFKGYEGKSFDYIIAGAVVEFYHYHCPADIAEDR